MSASQGKNFPLLWSYPNPDELERIKKQDPLFWRELQRIESITKRIFSRNKRRQKINILVFALRDIFGARGKSSEIYRRLNEALRRAQEFLKDLIAKIPVCFYGSLNSDGDIAEEEDFIALLIKRQHFLEKLRVDPDGPLARTKEFEARRLILLAIILFNLEIHARKLQLNGVSLQSITAYLERKFFTKDFSEPKTIIAFHNPDDDFRVECWYFEEDLPEVLPLKKGWVRKEYRLVFRKFCWQGKTYLVYFSCRTKTPTSHLLKMLRKDIRDPHSSALDFRGFKLVFLDGKALAAGLDKLNEDVFYFPGVTWKLEDGRHFRETVNSFSAKSFKVKKFVTTLGGEPVEIIVETLVNHINGIASQGEENHELYRCRQLIHSGLPLVFPKEIYGIDWVAQEEEILASY